MTCCKSNDSSFALSCFF